MTPPMPTFQSPPEPGLVSVVLPVKNGERFIGDALDAVTRQTYDRFEIIVVDGASTDRTEEIARTYDRVRWISQTQGGVAEAFNMGVEAAGGEFVAFIASDDRWEARKLELQVQPLVDDPDLDYVTCRLRFFHAEDQPLPPGFRPHLLEGDHVAKVLEALLARRSTFEQFGLFDPAFSSALDVEWFGRVGDLGATMQIIPELLLHKRVHSGNTSLQDVVDGNRLLLKIAQEALRRKGGLA